MTPPEHIFMGAIVANSAFAVRVLREKFTPSYGVLLAAGTLCAVLPDVDSFFGHYGSANPWVGHRGMTHSLLWCIIQAFVISFIFYRLRVKGGIGSIAVTGGRAEIRSAFLFLFAAALFASVGHVIADLPQPPSVWNGIPVFFPLKMNGEYVRNGGWGLVGWYDFRIMINLFLAAMLTGGICTVLIAAGKCLSRPVKRALGALVLCIGLGSFIWTGYYISTCSYESGRHWEQYQEEVLGSCPGGVRSVVLVGRQVFYDVFVFMRRHF